MSAVDVINLSASADTLLKDRVLALIELTAYLRRRQGQAVHTHRSIPGVLGRLAAMLPPWSNGDHHALDPLSELIRG